MPNDTLEAFKAVKAEPEPTKLEADKVLEVLFHVKFDDCKIDVVPLPIKIWFDVNVDVPIPPLVIDKVPNDTLEAFNEDKAEPEPTKLEADKVLFILSHVKFADCKIDVEPPINIWLLNIVVVPIPPRVIGKVPDVTLEAFKDVNCEPSPLIPPRA